MGTRKIEKDKVHKLEALDFFLAMNQAQREELEALCQDAGDLTEFRGALRRFMQFAGAYEEGEIAVTMLGRMERDL